MVFQAGAFAFAVGVVKAVGAEQIFGVAIAFEVFTCGGEVVFTHIQLAFEQDIVAAVVLFACLFARGLDFGIIAVGVHD